MNARWYDPTVGRFLTQDTYRGEGMNPLTQNRYAYVLNNPVNMWDPTGHVPTWVGDEMHYEISKYQDSKNYQIELWFLENSDDYALESKLFLRSEQSSNKKETYKYYKQLRKSTWLYDYYKVQHDNGETVTRDVGLEFYSDTYWGYYTQTITASESFAMNQEVLRDMYGNLPEPKLTKRDVVESHNGFIPLTLQKMTGDAREPQQYMSTQYLLNSKLNEFLDVKVHYYAGYTEEKNHISSFDRRTLTDLNDSLDQLISNGRYNKDKDDLTYSDYLDTIINGTLEDGAQILLSIWSELGTRKGKLGKNNILEYINIIWNGETKKTVGDLDGLTTRDQQMIEKVIKKSDLFGVLQYANKYGIDTYRDLRKETKGTGLEAHHIVEKRFIESIDISNHRGMTSVAVTKEEHDIFTQEWRKLIPRGTDYENLSREEIWEAAQEVYEDYPKLLSEAYNQIYWNLY